LSVRAQKHQGGPPARDLFTDEPQPSGKVRFYATPSRFHTELNAREAFIFSVAFSTF
jgi:hypothetical protein